MYRAIPKLNIIPAYRLIATNDEKEKPKQSYLEKPKNKKPEIRNQPIFFYANNI